MSWITVAANHTLPGSARSEPWHKYPRSFLRTSHTLEQQGRNRASECASLSPGTKHLHIIPCPADGPERALQRLSIWRQIPRGRRCPFASLMPTRATLAGDLCGVDGVQRRTRLRGMDRANGCRQGYREYHMCSYVLAPARCHRLSPRASASSHLHLSCVLTGCHFPIWCGRDTFASRPAVLVCDPLQADKARWLQRTDVDVLAFMLCRQRASCCVRHVLLSGVQHGSK